MQENLTRTNLEGSDPAAWSKRVPIFLGTREALIKMVPIYMVPISRSRTVKASKTYHTTIVALHNPVKSNAS